MRIFLATVCYLLVGGFAGAAGLVAWAAFSLVPKGNAPPADKYRSEPDDAPSGFGVVVYLATAALGFALATEAFLVATLYGRRTHDFVTPAFCVGASIVYLCRRSIYFRYYQFCATAHRSRGIRDCPKYIGHWVLWATKAVTTILMLEPAFRKGADDTLAAGLLGFPVTFWLMPLAMLVDGITWIPFATQCIGFVAALQLFRLGNQP